MPVSGDCLREWPGVNSLPTPLHEYRKVVDVLPLQDEEAAAERKSRPGGECSRLVAKILSKAKRKHQSAAITFKKLESQINHFHRSAGQNLSVVENASVARIMALTCFVIGKELEGCCNLINSHASCLRQQILYRNLKSKLRTSVLHEPMVNNLNPKDLDVDHTHSNTNPETLVSTLQELPSEWYVVQITAQHENSMNVRDRAYLGDAMYSLQPVHGLHLVILPTGENAINPMCITLPKPNADSSYDIRKEIEKLLNNNKSDLTAAYTNNELYWKMRKNQNSVMSTAISEVEFSWLREWRILLLGDYIEQLDLVQDIHNMIDKLLAAASGKDVSERSRWLLKKIATGACYLQPFEIERAVKFILPTKTKLAKNIILSIIAKTKVMDSLKDAKRKILILILDECLDHISFESISLLKHQPVTRFPSLHITYALYKQHKSTMKGGYKIIHKSDNLGTFIVNPSLDLTKMERRMKQFINYWLPKWEGLYGKKPDLKFFKNALTQYNILMYNGHGSGIQFLSGEEIERMRVLAAVFLFGCGSIKLLPVGGRLPAYGISNQYLMGCSPCILGMLWEVTDADIDKMTAEFMSRWIPSSAKRPWSDVNQTAWQQGSFQFNFESQSKKTNEQDMLVAVAKSKDVCKQYMTSAAIVVRGLPIKLVTEVK